MCFVNNSFYVSLVEFCVNRLGSAKSKVVPNSGVVRDRAHEFSNSMVFAGCALLWGQLSKIQFIEWKILSIQKYKESN